MKIILWLPLIFISNNIFAEEYILRCNGEEIKRIEGEISSQRLEVKVIGIQIYREGMMVNGEWFDSESDKTEDYLLEGSYLITTDNITGARNFSTTSLIEGREIQTVKIDKVEINTFTNDIFWTHEFNRVDKTNLEANTIYAFRKNFKGKCHS